ncbi:MAG: hypothetical protein R2932_54185 [Caldilineaceae bacterium]
MAFQLGISVRQLRRDQNNAIELLAERLWRQVSPNLVSPLQAQTPAGPLESMLHAEAIGYADVTQVLAANCCRNCKKRWPKRQCWQQPMTLTLP